jgi:hypothetical protein
LEKVTFEYGILLRMIHHTQFVLPTYIRFHQGLYVRAVTISLAHGCDAAERQNAVQRYSAVEVKGATLPIRDMDLKLYEQDVNVATPPGIQKAFLESAYGRLRVEGVAILSKLAHIAV